MPCFGRVLAPRSLAVALLAAAAASAASSVIACSLLLDDDLSTGGAAVDGAPPSTSDSTSGDGPPNPLDGSDGGGGSDEIGNGTGKLGPLVVNSETIVNAYAGLDKDVAAGSTTIEAAAANGFPPGDVVLLWEVTGLTGSASAATSPAIDLNGTPVGAYELSRIKTANGTSLELETPLKNSYRAGAAQIVRVPEHTDVTIAPTGLVRAPPWDGTRGGIVAVLATGKIEIEGEIRVDGAGFRGGRMYRNQNFSACPNLDGLPRDGYAAKGEGLAPAGFSDLGDAGDGRGGRGVVSTGGGGGNCHNAGGGGGGNAGFGGQGGRAWKTSNFADVGGVGGGATPAADLDNRLMMGGGGGAGDSENSPAEIACTGANGGGAVLLRASLILSKGMINARGLNGLLGDYNGGCGGGAGGSIVLRATTRISCNASIAASGGNGTSNGGTITAPGGGGGGGHIRFVASVIECEGTAKAGEPGVTSPGDSGLPPTFGATAGQIGIIVKKN